MKKIVFILCMVASTLATAESRWANERWLNIYSAEGAATDSTIDISMDLNSVEPLVNTPFQKKYWLKITSSQLGVSNIVYVKHYIDCKLKMYKPVMNNAQKVLMPLGNKQVEVYQGTSINPDWQLLNFNIKFDARLYQFGCGG